MGAGGGGGPNDYQAIYSNKLTQGEGGGECA